MAAGSSEDKLGKQFYNPNLGSSFAMLMSPLFMMGASISPKNIVVISFSNDETAEVSYDLVIKVSGTEKRTTVTMTVKKVGGEWKLDSEKFFPKKTEEPEEDKTDNMSAEEAKLISDSVNVVLSTSPLKSGMGRISGNAGYPSDAGLPGDINVYAYNIEKKTTIKNTLLDQETGEYEIDVPPGEYYVFAGITNDINDKANGFYNKNVLCGLSVSCKDETLIKVKVSEGERVQNINTGDWYSDEK